MLFLGFFKLFIQMLPPTVQYIRKFWESASIKYNHTYIIKIPWFILLYWLERKSFKLPKQYALCTVKCKSVPIGNYSKSVIKTMDNTFIRLFLVFLLSFFTILFTNVSANIEVTFMKKILNKCTRKLQSFEQSDVSFSSKLLAKAVPPSKLQSKYIHN